MPVKDESARILIVDDEKINIDVLVGLLKPHYRVITAKDGQQALKRLQNKDLLPDLILLDVMMPGMDGYEVCRTIKSKAATRDIPVIFISSMTGEQDETTGFKAGAVDYITKPFRPQIALARVKTHIELKRRGDMLERLAGLDGLTGIPNRRRFDQFLDAEFKRASRHRQCISLIIIDIDFFKLFNDHYGHTEGDECLKKIARGIFKSIPRTEDLAARYGGEEFACVLPQTTDQGALVVANRIMQNVGESKIPHARSTVADQVTVSIGVATVCPNPNDLPLSLLGMADKALYQAKQKGRNQIVNLGDCS